MEIKTEEWTGDHYRRLLDNLLEGFQIIDRQWRYVYLNKAAITHSRQTPEDLIGKTMMECYPDIENTDLFLMLQTCIEEQSARTIENNFKYPDGSSGWFELHVEPFPEGLVILSFDITERKHLEEQNLRLQRMETVGSLAGGIVHDMNNILGPIMLSLAVLRKRLTNAGDQKFIDVLETNSKRAADLVKQILTFARGAAQNRSPVRPSFLIDEVMKLLKPTFPSNITLTVSIQPNLWMISADAVQIHQVLTNLAVNARDAMADGGTLSIEVENVTLDERHARMFPGKPGIYVLFRITDTGSGIPPENLKKIFDPFFTTKELGKGTGLGLSTVASIVKGHQGIIDVSSDVGTGTQFRFYIPAITSEKELMTHHDIIKAIHGNGELILVVDDDAIIREIASVTLETGGYSVINAADGTEALALYTNRQNDIKLVLTDMDMPVMDGATLARFLRKLNSSVSIVGSSGTSVRPTLKELESFGMNAFLPKPYTSEILLRMIYDTLNRK